MQVRKRPVSKKEILKKEKIYQTDSIFIFLLLVATVLLCFISLSLDFDIYIDWRKS